MKPPEVSHARSGDVAIAYQVVGSVPVDIVFVRGITRDVLSTWEQPLLVSHGEGLAASGRVLMLDKRGTGLSDRVREWSRSTRRWMTFGPSWTRPGPRAPCACSRLPLVERWVS